MSSLRALLFDIDDTLCATTAFALRARKAAVQAMVDAGLPASADEVFRELTEVLTEFGSNYDHHFDKLLQRLFPSGLGDVNPALVVAAGVAAYHDTKFKELAPFEDVVPLFEALKKAGIRIGIITHGLTSKQAEKLVRMKVVRFLDPEAIFISDQIGISKPNPKLYQSALRRMNLQPNETMYIGDNPLNDIAPPKELGMVAVWIKRAAKQDATKLGVEPHHTIENFDELQELLRTEYGVPCSTR